MLQPVDGAGQRPRRRSDGGGAAHGRVSRLAGVRAVSRAAREFRQPPARRRGKTPRARPQGRPRIRSSFFVCRWRSRRSQSADRTLLSPVSHPVAQDVSHGQIEGRHVGAPRPRSSGAERLHVRPREGTGDQRGLRTTRVVRFPRPADEGHRSGRRRRREAARGDPLPPSCRGCRSVAIAQSAQESR